MFIHCTAGVAKTNLSPDMAQYGTIPTELPTSYPFPMLKKNIGSPSTVTSTTNSLYIAMMGLNESSNNPPEDCIFWTLPSRPNQ